MQHSLPDEAILQDVLRTLYPDTHQNTFRQWLRDKRVSIDGHIVEKMKTPCQKGQKIEIKEHRVKYEKDIPIVFEDAHIVVVEKPVGLLSVKSEKEKSRTVHSFLKKRYYPHTVYVIHRLDRDTSGLMVFARTREAFSKLKKELKDRKVKRQYYALLEGKIDKKGCWKTFLYEDANYRVHVSDREGEEAVTYYERLSYSKNTSTVRFTLETGKKNQIRVQAAHFGHPLYGDKKYGGKPHKRLCLHAETLAFTHPVTGKKLSFSSPLRNKEDFILFP